MNVRKANTEDIKELAVLFNAYRMFYDKQSDIAGAICFLTNRFKKDDSEVFVAEEEGRLLGFVQLYPLFSSTRMKPMWLLNDLFVHQDYRGKGISLQLIDCAKQLVKNTGACGMYLETEKTNIIGNQLYPRAGFSKYDDVHFYEWNVPQTD